MLTVLLQKISGTEEIERDTLARKGECSDRLINLRHSQVNRSAIAKEIVERVGDDVARAVIIIVRGNG